MNVKYPIFGQDKDKWMFMIETKSGLGHLENIDIEGQEYVGWDVDGKPIEFYLENNNIKVRYTSSEYEPEKLREAILNYVKLARPKVSFIYNEHKESLVELFRSVEQHIENSSFITKIKNLVRKKKQAIT